MRDISPFKTVIIGKLSRETIINAQYEVLIDQAGGNLLYTAYGYRLWNGSAGLISRVGQNYPQEWVDELAKKEFDTRGITRSPSEIDCRRFYAIDPQGICIDNPQKHFNNLSLPFPKELLGYSSEQIHLDSRKHGTCFTIKPGHIPAEYFEARYLMVCPVDFLTHSLIPAHMRARSGMEVILHPSRSYLHTSFYHDFTSIVRGARAVIASQDNLQNLFLGKSEDIREIVETISEFGVDLVVVTRKADGYLLFDRYAGRRSAVPAYPVKLVDPIGADDAFCGGFLAGLIQSGDPLMGVQMGSVSASIKMEGSTAAYILETLPELAKARLETIKEQTVLC